ncbi:hypothetical protein GIB67_034846 [Kingdonia uniflora]|uniref:Aminotransferase-like plant mobile domain-containing protein n=1 Tax=Kingdonia uniflora TaxID=39325 RepID=A0A7J7MEE4_9MAGN|nr:hypothetical protein GIB67_034846 [Kingdonia uniflora]
MLTSLSIGRYPTQVPYDDTWSILSNARQLLLNIDSSYIRSGNISISHLRTYLTVADDREDDFTIARAFILFMMGYLWFQTGNNTVPHGYLAAVDDLDSAAQYDWVLLFLFPCTMVWIPQSRSGVPSLDLSNFLRMQYWFYEYCGAGRPIVKEEVKFSAYLLLRVWKRGNRRKTNDQTTNLFILGRYHINHRTIEAITWDLESARDAQRFRELEDELTISHRQIDSIDHQLYTHDLQLRKGCDVRAMPLPPGGGARMRQHRSGSRTRGGGTSRRRRSTREDSE